jgi:hypothetical protein
LQQKKKKVGKLMWTSVVLLVVPTRPCTLPLNWL